MTPEELNTIQAIFQVALETHGREVDGALHRLANRLEQRARRQAQLFAQLHFCNGQVPVEVTDLITKIWLD